MRRAAWLLVLLVAVSACGGSGKRAKPQVKAQPPPAEGLLPTGGEIVSVGPADASERAKGDQPDAMYGPDQGSVAQKLYTQASTWR